MNQEPDAGQQDQIANLVRTAGRRALPDAARFERARQKVNAEWREVLAREQRIRQYRIAAVLIIAALGLGLADVFWPRAPQPVATANRVIGDVLVRQVHEGRVRVEPLKSEQVLVSGTELDTGSSGRVRLDWTNEAHLSVDQGSLVELRSENELRLTRGAVYVETNTHNMPEAQRLVVTTPFGAARHIGTQFEVVVAATNTRVRVREGIVSFSTRGRPALTLHAGQQLSAAADSVSVERGPGSADSAWDWLNSFEPALVIEGRSAFDVLESLSQNSGLRIVYANEKARAQARSVTVRGSLGELESRKALAAVLTSSGLVFDIQQDRVLIRASDEP